MGQFPQAKFLFRARGRAGSTPHGHQRSSRTTPDIPLRVRVHVETLLAAQNDMGVSLPPPSRSRPRSEGRTPWNARTLRKWPESIQRLRPVPRTHCRVRRYRHHPGAGSPTPPPRPPRTPRAPRVPPGPCSRTGWPVGSDLTTLHQRHRTPGPYGQPRRRPPGSAARRAALAGARRGAVALELAAAERSAPAPPSASASPAPTSATSVPAPRSARSCTGGSWTDCRSRDTASRNPTFWPRSPSTPATARSPPASATPPATPSLSAEGTDAWVPPFGSTTNPRATGLRTAPPRRPVHPVRRPAPGPSPGGRAHPRRHGDDGRGICRPPAPGARRAGGRPAPHRSPGGGDWYDALPLPDAALGLAVGSVTGSGPSAVAAMGRPRRASLRAYAVMEGEDPVAVLSDLELLLRLTEPARSATALFGYCEPALLHHIGRRRTQPAPADRSAAHGVRRDLRLRAARHARLLGSAQRGVAGPAGRTSAYARRAAAPHRLTRPTAPSPGCTRPGRRPPGRTAGPGRGRRARPAHRAARREGGGALRGGRRSAGGQVRMTVSAGASG
ncbi:hypothetical protein SVIOM342S_06402 [Streptomyces violaceorubidus]